MAMWRGTIDVIRVAVVENEVNIQKTKKQQYAGAPVPQSRTVLHIRFTYR